MKHIVVMTNGRGFMRVHGRTNDIDEARKIMCQFDPRLSSRNRGSRDVATKISIYTETESQAFTDLCPQCASGVPIAQVGDLAYHISDAGSVRCKLPRGRR